MKNTIKNEMVGVGLLGLGGYIFYVLISNGVTEKAGFLGKGLFEFLSLLFGDFVWGIPIALIIYGVLFIISYNNSLKLNKLKMISMLLCLVFIMALTVVFSMPPTMGAESGDGAKEILRAGLKKENGGALGTAIALGLFYVFGKTGEIIALITLIVIMSLIFANTLLKKIFGGVLEIFNSKNYEGKIEKNKSSRSERIKKEINNETEFEEERETSVENKKKEITINPEAINSFESEKKNSFFGAERETNEVQSKKNLSSDNNRTAEVPRIDDIFINKEIDHKQRQELEKSIKIKSGVLEQVLKEYGIEAKVINYSRGPVITRFELSVPRGMRVKKITALADDLAMNLEAKSLRIEAPIPGKNAVGIEIPNDIQEAVYFSTIFNSEKMKKSKTPLDIILGKSIVGEDVVIDLGKMPHLLVAGRTGSGKSVCINTLISTIISKSEPDMVKFIMVDPKMVELMQYNDIPHLLLPVITEPKLAAVALKWAVNEMEDRYKTLSKVGVRNLEGYNKLSNVTPLPYIVVVIDELADLMMVAPASIEESIARIAQKARAIGIHLVVATQRPSVDVITGTIKANLPSRISFAVASQIDSRTILDEMGAEKLLGKGDMLFRESGSPNMIRIQGAFISDDEIVKLTTYLKQKGIPEYREDILTVGADSDVDELFEQAVEIIKNEGKASISLIQRRLKVGYSRAARIFDQLKDNGIISDE
jgi:DNA segregation ATPase FtsK/SpoIIIE, S-DNA-T family